MTGVLTVGFAMPPLASATVAGPALSGLDADGIPGLVELLRVGVRANHRVVVLYPECESEPTLRHLQTARRAIGGTRIALHPIAASPVAAAVVATFAAQLAGAVSDAGVLLAALRVMERQVVTVAWLNRLTGLRSPAPSLAEHALSLLPGTRWAVCSWPEPAVHRIWAVEVPLPIPRAAVSVVLADHRGDPAWIRDQVAARLDATVREVQFGTTIAGWWGTSRVTEAAAFPRDLAAIALKRMERVRGRACRWCGGPTCGRACPWCGERWTRPAADPDRTRAAPAQSAASAPMPIGSGVAP